MSTDNIFFRDLYYELIGKIKTVDEKSFYYVEGKWVFGYHWITYFDESNNFIVKYFDESGLYNGYSKSEIDLTRLTKRNIIYKKDNTPLYLHDYEWDGEKLTVRFFYMDEFRSESVFNHKGDLIYYYDADTGAIDQYKFDERGFLIEEIKRYGFLNKNNRCDTVDIIKYDCASKFATRRRYNLETFDLIREYEYFFDESGEIQIEILPNGEMNVIDNRFLMVAHTVKDNYGNAIILDYINQDGNPTIHIERSISYYE